MAKEMLINASEGEECRIAVVEDGRLEELYMERTSSTSHVGNIYKGKVTNVEASIQAAFIDFGLGRNGFLHISDLMPSYFGKKHEDVTEAVGRKISRRDRPPIQRCLKRGDEIIVQIIKEGIGTKGPTLSTYVSIPGRILVMMPGMSKFGISRKIEDEDERRRLRGILDGLKCPDDVGFIVRTAGVGKSKIEISRDLQYLTRLWKNINDKMKQPAPQELYTEGDLVTRTVRDVFSAEIEQIVVDSKEVAKRIKDFFKIAMPRTKNKVELYDEPTPLFHKYNIESEIEKIYSRHVPLPSGGSLVIDQTEAIVAIDVNSGKFRDHSDAETTAFKTDMEAADEIPRQLKLRDLGGVIICDFIDLRFERHRRELEQRLHENLKNDRAKSKVLRMSQFGIVEMTRQRMRPSLKKSIYCDCPHCKGSGLVKTPESMSLDMMRRLMIATTNEKVVRVELSVHPEVASVLLNKKRIQLSEMEKDREKRIIVRHDGSLALDEFRLTLFDQREGLVYLSELGILPPTAHKRPGPPSKHDQRGGRRDNRNRGRDREETVDDERFDREEDDALPRGAASREPDSDADSPAEKALAKRTAAAALEGEEIEGDEEEAESQVIDVEDGDEPMGDAPRGFEDRNDRFRNRGGRHDNRRGRDDRGRDNRNRGDNRPNNRADNRTDNRDNRADNRVDNRSHGPRPQPAPRPLPPPKVAVDQDADVPVEPHDDSLPPREGGHAPQQYNDQDQQGGRRRRRRRRGGRGRGGGGGGQGGFQQQGGGQQPRSPLPPVDDEQPPIEGDDSVYNDMDNEIPAPGNEKDGPDPNFRPKDDDGKRRRRRGGRKHRERRERTGGPKRQGGGGGIGHHQAHRKPRYEGLPNVEGEEEIPPPRVPTALPPPPRQDRPNPAPPPKINVVRTGSADKHLADDHPVDHAPVSRPRSYRDLDELPDFDD